MGFWHTSYIEFHEETGLGDHYVPTPPVYRCSQCEETFASPDELRQHRFVRHPVRRPVIMISGAELGALPYMVAVPIKPTDILIENATAISLNGEAMPLSQLQARLASLKSDVARIRLGSANVSADFEVRFQIAEERDLEGVESALARMARRGERDRRAIDNFIEESRAFTTAMSYCNGVCEYLYGTLEKDGRAGLAAAPAYTERFNSAVNSLSPFGRPLSKAICALVAFHFNQFSEATTASSRTRLGLAAKRYHEWLNGQRSGSSISDRRFDALKLELLLTDDNSEQIVEWSVLPFDRVHDSSKDIDAFMTSGIAQYDQAKLRVLLAEARLAAGDVAGARRYAREVVNSNGFERWAESILRIEA